MAEPQLEERQVVSLYERKLAENSRQQERLQKERKRLLRILTAVRRNIRLAASAAPVPQGEGSPVKRPAAAKKPVPKKPGPAAKPAKLAAKRPAKAQPKSKTRKAAPPLTTGGLNIREFSRDFLAKAKEPQNLAQIAEALRAAGFKSKSKDFPDTVRSVLKKYRPPKGPFLSKNGRWSLAAA